MFDSSRAEYAGTMRWLAVSLLILTVACSAPAKRSEERRKEPAKEVRAETGLEARTEPAAAQGKFAYYVLSLSWSPQYCASSKGSRDPIQCAGPKTFAFVAHGLWPQYERGWPESCSSAQGPDKKAINAMLDIMPSPKLVRHEWEKHGTCSGLEPQPYLDTLRKAYNSIKVPEDYQQPLRQVTAKPAALKKKFAEANHMAENSFAVLCSGRYLSEVRFCLDKSLNSRACGQDVRDQCRAAEVILRPVR